MVRFERFRSSYFLNKWLIALGMLIVLGVCGAYIYRFIVQENGAAGVLATPVQLPDTSANGALIPGTPLATSANQKTYLPFTALKFVSSGQFPYSAADDWPQFRHDPQRTAATPQELSGSLTIRWKKGFHAWPSVFAELAVVSGRVYLANTDGTLTCLDGENGNELWEFNSGAALLTTPAIVDGLVHIVNIKGRLLTLDTNGNLLWEYDLPGDVYANPVVSGGRIFLGSVDGTFYAFDAQNGSQGPLWTYPTGAMIDTAPVEIDGKVIFAAENMTAYALNTSDGSLVWKTTLPGVHTWNGNPVASIKANKVYFSTITEFFEPSSTYREVFSMYDFENRTGPLSGLAQFADQFIAQNRARLQPAVVLNASTGQTVTRFTVAPDNAPIAGLPFSTWYWGSIRPALWQGDKLYLQSMWRNILVNLSTDYIYQPNADQTKTGQFVRGDEQVPVSIGGNRVYGGIGKNVAYLNLVNGERGNLLGVYGSEAEDSTPLTPPLETGDSNHYLTLPGDGYTDRIGTLIVADGHAYYQQYGWVYCFDGVITERP
jgi:outer membrane protein assembly factor BamB